MSCLHPLGGAFMSVKYATQYSYDIYICMCYIFKLFILFNKYNFPIILLFSNRHANSKIMLLAYFRLENIRVVFRLKWGFNAVKYASEDTYDYVLNISTVHLVH